MLFKILLFNLISKVKSWVKANRFTLSSYLIQFFLLLWWTGSIIICLCYLAAKITVKAAGKKLKTWCPEDREKKWWEFWRPRPKTECFIPKEGDLSTPTVESLKLINTTDRKLESIRQNFETISLEDLKNIEVTFEETRSRGPWERGYQDPNSPDKWRKDSQHPCQNLASESDLVSNVEFPSGPYNPSNFLLTDDPINAITNVSDLCITMQYFSDIDNIPQELPFYSDLVRNYYTLKELPFYPTDETVGNFSILDEIYMDLIPTGDICLPRGLYSEFDNPRNFDTARGLPLDLDFYKDFDVLEPEQYFWEDFDTPRDSDTCYSDDIFSLLLETWV